MSDERLLEFEGPFDQTRITRVRHRLARHPLMKMESLFDLALRHDSEYVRYHDGEREFRTVFGDILTTDPGRTSLRRAIDNLDRSKVFIQINTIRHDRIYGELIKEFTNDVERLLPESERGRLTLDAAAFLASPGSVTPYHLDHEQNFLLHIQGPKTIHVWDGRDRSIASSVGLEAFYGEPTLREVPYREEVARLAQVIELRSGDGVYMPMGSPHAVRTGSEVTITFSVLFNTSESVREIETFKANHLLRRLGLAPTPIGAAPNLDAAKRGAYRVLRIAKAALRGRRPEPLRYI